MFISFYTHISCIYRYKHIYIYLHEYVYIYIYVRIHTPNNNPPNIKAPDAEEKSIVMTNTYIHNNEKYICT
jgi:hypothetical protein